MYVCMYVECSLSSDHMEYSPRTLVRDVAGLCSAKACFGLPVCSVVVLKVQVTKYAFPLPGMGGLLA